MKERNKKKEKGGEKREGKNEKDATIKYQKHKHIAEEEGVE